MIDSSVEKAEELIAEDPTITLRFLALELGVSCGSRHMLSSTSSLVALVQEVRKMDPPPVNNRTEGTKGDNLPQLLATI